MKNAVLYLNILFCATFMLACEQDVEVFHASGEDRLNFYYEENAEADSLIDYTFIYLPSEQMLDTIWFDVETSGYVTDYPRTISFEQMAVDSNAAIPDVHYVAFDNPELQNVYVVPEQELPDGEFPTVSYPNPEAAEAFELALKLAKEKDADLVLATDPDADRLGVYVKDTKSGEYIALTGNMSGCLLADYEISQIKETKGLPEDGKLIKTIVTSNLADAIAKYYDVDLIEVLTGFKFIGQQILGFETTGKGKYLFGFEESYGCLIGTHARDKDAIVATMALCEAAAYYKTKNMTLWDAMIAMYERYGYYKDGVQAVTMKGIEGLAKIQEIMATLRKEPLKEFCGHKVTSFRDYQADTITDITTGEVKPTGLPKSNVLYFDMSDNVWMCIRPSGTEPKIKFYYGVVGTSLEDADKQSEEMAAAVTKLVESMS